MRALPRLLLLAWCAAVACEGGLEQTNGSSDAATGGISHGGNAGGTRALDAGVASGEASESGATGGSDDRHRFVWGTLEKEGRRGVEPQGRRSGLDDPERTGSIHGITCPGPPPGIR